MGVPLSKIPEPKTWDDVKRWGDILDDESKYIIRDILARTPGEKLCPCLRRIVEDEKVAWIYCQVRYDELKKNGCVEQERPSFDDPRYRADVACAYLLRLKMCFMVVVYEPAKLGINHGKHISSQERGRITLREHWKYGSIPQKQWNLNVRI